MNSFDVGRNSRQIPAGKRIMARRYHLSGLGPSLNERLDNSRHGARQRGQERADRIAELIRGWLGVPMQLLRPRTQRLRSLFLPEGTCAGAYDREQEHFLAWAEPVAKFVGGAAGVVEGNVLHLWRGDFDARRHRKHRSQCERMLALEHEQTGEHDFLRSYFASRREDG